MKYQNILVIVLLLMAGAAVFSFTSGLFSLINDGGEIEGPSCQVPKEGGSCDLILSLPAQQKVADGYSFDLITTPIYDEEFKDEQVVNLVASGGPYVEQDFRYSFSEESFWVYLYDVPNWKNVYQYRVVSTAAASARTSSDGLAYAEMSVGYVKVPYTYSQIEICNYDDDDLCANKEYYLMKQYTSSDGEKIADYSRWLSLTSTDSIKVKGSSSSTPSSLSRDLVKEIIIPSSSMPLENKRFAASTIKDVTYYKFATVTIAQPTLKASYKEEYAITNLKVKIGDNEVIMYPGKITDRIYLPSLTNEINEYCGRTGFNPRQDECVIKMTFTSDRGGNIIIASELGELTPVGGGFDFSGITGWVTFDYSQNPINASMTTILALLLFGGVIFLIMKIGGKKK